MIQAFTKPTENIFAISGKFRFRELEIFEMTCFWAMKSFHYIAEIIIVCYYYQNGYCKISPKVFFCCLIIYIIRTSDFPDYGRYRKRLDQKGYNIGSCHKWPHLRSFVPLSCVSHIWRFLHWTLLIGLILDNVKYGRRRRKEICLLVSKLSTRKDWLCLSFLSS